MAKASISPEDQHKQLVRQMWCLVYGRNSINLARATAEQFLTLSSREAASMKYTFVSSAVVSYSMPFITNVSLGEVPKRYRSFQSEAHKKTHDAVIHARNTIYAHVDSTENDHHFQMLVEQKGEGSLEYSYRPYLVALEPVVFPELIELCSFQSERMRSGIHKLMPMLVPPNEVGNYLLQNGLTETVVNVPWPDR